MESKDDEKDNQLEGENPPPGIEGGQVTAKDKAKNAARRGDSTPYTEGECAFFPLVGPGNERYRCRDHQHRADPLYYRPAHKEHSCVLADCGRKSPDTIYRSTGQKRPLPPEEVLELCPDQHESGLHQSIDGDNGLDGRGSGVQIMHQGADGDFHGGGVDDQDEYRQADDDEDTPWKGVVLFHRSV